MSPRRKRTGQEEAEDAPGGETRRRNEQRVQPWRAAGVVQQWFAPRSGDGVMEGGRATDGYRTQQGLEIRPPDDALIHRARGLRALACVAYAPGEYGFTPPTVDQCA